MQEELLKSGVFNGIFRIPEETIVSRLEYREKHGTNGRDDMMRMA